MLVATVVMRKIAVHAFIRFPVRSPNRTTTPEKIPARLMMTCTSVYVASDMPKIMARRVSLHRVSQLLRMRRFHDDAGGERRIGINHRRQPQPCARFVDCGSQFLKMDGFHKDTAKVRIGE